MGEYRECGAPPSLVSRDWWNVRDQEPRSNGITSSGCISDAGGPSGPRIIVHVVTLEMRTSALRPLAELD